MLIINQKELEKLANQRREKWVQIVIIMNLKNNLKTYEDSNHSCKIIKLESIAYANYGKPIKSNHRTFKKINTERLQQLSKPRINKDDRNNPISKSIIETEFDVGISKNIFHLDINSDSLK